MQRRNIFTFEKFGQFVLVPFFSFHFLAGSELDSNSINSVGCCRALVDCCRWCWDVDQRRGRPYLWYMMMYSKAHNDMISIIKRGVVILRILSCNLSKIECSHTKLDAKKLFFDAATAMLNGSVRCNQCNAERYCLMQPVFIMSQYEKHGRNYLYI